MSAIDIKLKSYDELIFEITTLNTNKYLLEQKLNKQKEVLDKIRNYLEKQIQIYGGGGLAQEQLENFNELLEEIEEPQEHKIPEKIDAWDRRWHYYYTKKEKIEEIKDNVEYLREKLNKIIDYLDK